MWHQHEFIFTYLRKVCPAQQVGSPSSRVGRSKKILKIQKLIWQLFLVFLHLVKSSVFMFMLKPLFKLVIHKFTWRHLLPGPELQGGVSGWVQCWAGLKTVFFQLQTEWQSGQSGQSDPKNLWFHSLKTRAHNLCHDNRQLIVLAINCNHSASKNNCN